MKLGQKQELFMRLLPRLIDKAHELGFDVKGRIYSANPAFKVSTPPIKNIPEGL